QSTLLVPSEAVIRTGKRALVMLAEGDGRYRPQEITLGREADGRLEVLSGLEEGQAVVTSGQFLIDSEASLQGILAGNAEQDSTEGLHVSHG
ncbi:efflux RND transporter periplasmic adaptor subunit, partial [Enterobacter hormaechei]